MPMLDELLAIKQFREQQAEASLYVARSTLAEAHRTEQQAADDLDQYRSHARKQEDASYQALFARVVKVRDIAELHQDLAILRSTELQYRSELDQATAHREMAQQAHHTATQVAREARTIREKFVELVSRDQDARARNAEYRESLEYEELASIVRERDEAWESADD